MRVLVYGTIDAGVCDMYRFGMYAEPLARHGIELRAMTSYELAVPPDAESSEAAYSSERTVFERSQLDWADVIVFRRFYATQWTCGECAFISKTQPEMDRHVALTEHRPYQPDRLIRPLFDALERHGELLRGRAVMYETDDDLLHVQPWNGVGARVANERSVVERMIRRADLVTVSTPVLADRLAPENAAIRVVRNAIDPSWYAPREKTDPSSGPRILYYGKPNRMRDYAVCRRAVDRLVRRIPSARRVWLGALNAPAGGPAEPVLAAVDEALPYVEGVRDFAASLVAARPDIGLAPVVGDMFDRAKSELHWLEYSMAGAATVATSAVPGPFDVIRHGVDGFVAGDTWEWLAALSRLAESPSLREEITARARERILQEYTIEVRAAEWADAYRWAAEHAGRGARVPGFALGSAEVARLRREAQAGLAYRMARRERLDRAEGELERLRAGREVCSAEETAADPLVSVVVPVVDEPPYVVARAIRSAVAQTYRSIEIVVAGETPRAAELSALADLVADGRLRIVLAPPAAPEDDGVSEAAAEYRRFGAVLTAGIDGAGGSWIAPLSPETTFTADHVEVLLSVARENALEFVYGQAHVELGPDATLVLGMWPPSPDGVLTGATEIFAAPLARIATYDPEAWREGESPGWAFWRGIVAAGARIAGIEQIVSELTPAIPPAAGPAEQPRLRQSDAAASAPAGSCAIGA